MLATTREKIGNLELVQYCELKIKGENYHSVISLSCHPKRGKVMHTFSSFFNKTELLQFKHEFVLDVVICKMHI